MAATLGNMGYKTLCSLLGYEKGHPHRNLKSFTAEVNDFLDLYEYEKQRIPPTAKVHLSEARLCAVNFLEHEKRGERLFTPNPTGGVTWSKDRDL
jgi:hypothetical protein